MAYLYILQASTISTYHMAIISHSTTL